jgi:hypothetical protein
VFFKREWPLARQSPAASVSPLMVCRFGRSEIFISAAINVSDLNRHRHPADGAANSQPLTPVLLHLCGAEIYFHVAGDDSSVAANLTDFREQR